MQDLHKILTAIQEEIGGDDPCRVTVDLERDGGLRFSAAWDDLDWSVQTRFTREQIELAIELDIDMSCMVDLFVVLVKESEQYKCRQEGAG